MTMIEALRLARRPAVRRLSGLVLAALASLAPVPSQALDDISEENVEELFEETEDTRPKDANIETQALPLGPAFEALPGRWIGDGRLGFKDGKREQVTCRVTYFVSEDRAGLKQNIRCASPSGRIEVKSEVKNNQGRLTGSWTETVYNLVGDLSGEVTPRGLRVMVNGADLNASMDIMVKGTEQIVEIHFNSATLTGMTLILKKG